jgi:putative nucleotidyltransferase with HDIG domain
MSIEPNLEEQQLLEETLRRRGLRLTIRERVAESVSVAGFIAAATAVWAIEPPHPFAVVPAIVCLLVLALSVNVRFDTPLGFTVATQVAFIPLLFAMPPALVPVAVPTAFVLAWLPKLIRGTAPPGRLLIQISNAWFAIGPAAVFAIAEVEPRQAGPALLIAAVAAQFVVDFAVAAFRSTISREATLVAQLRETWVYAVDAALTPVGLLAAASSQHVILGALAIVPLLGLLAVFARERRRRLENTLELSNAYRGTALVLGDVVEADDSYTGEHCKSVVALTLAVAARLKLSAERRRNLEFAALLHDVGKVAIPKEIINKPGKLDPHEWAIIKTHTVEGQKMLDRVGGFMREVGLIVRAHHERWDGGGYPDGLAGEAIPLEARIISCCDTWNAMRTDRPYRKALSYEIASAELRSASGTQLDPNLVESLLEIVASEAPVEEPALLDEPAPVTPEPAPVTPGEAGAPQPQLAYDFARQAC